MKKKSITIIRSLLETGSELYSLYGKEGERILGLIHTYSVLVTVVGSLVFPINELHFITMPTIHLRKLRPRDIKSFELGHKVTK